VQFEVRDVAQDPQAAAEVVRRTGQYGVPVIADAEEAIVGFDVPRLRRMAARHARPSLGVQVADVKGGPGAYVGSVREGSLAARAGVQPGDVIVELSGAPVTNVADLERIAAARQPGQPTSLVVRRNGERRTLIAPGS
jgi:S1-C subfamily serine protease